MYAGRNECTAVWMANGEFEVMVNFVKQCNGSYNSCSLFG